MDLPDRPVQEELLRRTARLRVAVGGELGSPPLVLPNGDFFPDAFTGDVESLERLVARMQRHAQLEDIPIRARVNGDPSPTGGACGSGACAAPAPTKDSIARLEDHGDEWVLNIDAAELAHPTALTTIVARALGRVFLTETLPEGSVIEEPAEVTAELAAVDLGFGALLMQGAYLYSKSCGGPSVSQLTALSLPELAIATSSFAMAHGHSLRRAARELDTTQRALLDDARAWAETNADLLRRLHTRPESFQTDALPLEEASSWLLRLWRKPRKTDDQLFEEALSGQIGESTLAVAAGLGGARSAGRMQKRPGKHDDLRALVDEALALPTAESNAE